MLRRVMMAGGTSHSVSFISATGTDYGTTTSISSPSSPSGIQNGDGLFAVVMARGAITPPAGWSLVKSQNNTNTADQTVYVYRKDSVSTSDSSTAFTWTAASGSRIGLAYIVARSTSGVVDVAETDSTTQNYTSTTLPHNVPAPVLTADANGELFIVAATSAIASVSPSTSTWAAGASGLSIRTTATQAENRLAAFTAARNAGQSNGTPITYTSSAGGSSNGAYSSITIRLRAG